MRKIAVIGAGLAGLSAAAHLHSSGHKVHVFEKARGRGGRMSTKRLDYGDLDIGAQYFTAKSKAFSAAVSHWQSKNLVQEWSFTPFKSTHGKLAASPDDTKRYVGSPGMNALCHELSQNLDIRYQTRISRLRRIQGRWRLETHSGQAFQDFDCVVMAIPAEQARALLTLESSLSARIPQDIHLPCWALGLATQGEVEPRIEGIFGDEVISWVSRLNKKPGRKTKWSEGDVWMLHFAPEWTQAQGKNTEAKLEDIAVSWLQQDLATELEFQHSYRHFWRYANITPAFKEAIFPEGFVYDELEQLVLVGDWCAGGRVEGAYLSGYEAAKALA